MFCAISGEPPTTPVVSKKSGLIYEQRLILKYIQENGKDPVTGEELSEDDLLELKPNPKVAVPRPPTISSVPSLLTSLQNEYDAVMLELFSLKKSYDSVRQELAHALYVNDSANRVVARLIWERDEARTALASIKESLGQNVSDVANTNGAGAEDAEMSDASSQGLPKEVLAKVEEASKTLSSTRKTKLKRKPESYTQPSNVSTLTQSDLLPSMHGTRPAGVTALDVSRDGALLATGGKDKHVQIYDKSTGKIAATLKGHTKEITHVAFAQSSIGLEHGNVAADAQAPTYVVSSAADDSVRVWQAAEKGGFTLLHTLSEFKGAVTGLGIHPSGEIFATSSKDGSIVIFDVSSGRQLLRTETPHEFTSLDVHPDGILVAAGTKDGAIYIYDIRSGQQSASFTSDASGSIVSSLSFSENGYLLASATGAQVEVWDLRKLNKTTSITLESLPSKSEGSVVRFDPSAQFLAIGGGGVRILANKSWEVLWTSGDGDAPTADVTDLKWTWSSGALILSSLDRTVRTFATKVE